MSRNPLTAEVENRMVALLVDNVPMSTIRDIIEQEFGRTMNYRTVMSVRARNKDVIIKSKERSLTIAVATAKSLKDRAHNLLERVLNLYENDMSKLDALQKLYDTGVIDVATYNKGKKGLKLPAIKELTDISKEMSQQIDAGGYTPPETSSPKQPRVTSLSKEVKEMIDRGDEVALERVVFNKKEDEDTKKDA